MSTSIMKVINNARADINPEIRALGDRAYIVFDELLAEGDKHYREEMRLRAEKAEIQEALKLLVKFAKYPKEK